MYSDPRANALLKRIREVWDNAPTNIAMEGAAVRIPGDLVPLEDIKAGMKEFLLVPYFGACIHSPGAEVARPMKVPKEWA
jgi:uncharacterized protein